MYDYAENIRGLSPHLQIPGNQRKDGKAFRSSRSSPDVDEDSDWGAF